MSRAIETVIFCWLVSSQMMMRNKTKNTDMEGTISLMNTDNAKMLLMKNAIYINYLSSILKGSFKKSFLLLFFLKKMYFFNYFSLREKK